MATVLPSKVERAVNWSRGVKVGLPQGGTRPSKKQKSFNPRGTKRNPPLLKRAGQGAAWAGLKTEEGKQTRKGNSASHLANLLISRGTQRGKSSRTVLMDGESANRRLTPKPHLGKIRPSLWEGEPRPKKKHTVQ